MTDLAKIIIEAVDRTGAAFSSAKQGMQDLGNQATTLKGTLTGLGAAVAGGVFALKIKEAIDMQAALKDLAEQAGMTVEELSSLQRASVLSGTSMESVVGSYQKLSKALIEARDPMSSQAQALKSIGLSYEELARLKPNEQFKTIADALAGYNDGFEKNALLMQLFGKSGADLQKFLKELAAQSELTARVTNEQAEAADNLKDRLDLLTMKSQDMYLAIATNLVPALITLMNAFESATSKGGGMKGMIAEASADGRLKEWCRDAAMALAFVVDAGRGVVSVLEIIGVAIGAEASKWAGYGQAAMGAMQMAAGQTAVGMLNIREGLAQVKSTAQSFAADIDGILSRPQFRDKLREQFKTDDAQREMDMLRAAIDKAEAAGKSVDFDPDLAKKVEKARKEAEKLGEEFEKLMGRIFGKSAGVDPGFTKDLKDLEAFLKAGKFGKGEEGLQAYVAAVEALIRQQPFLREQIKATEEAWKRGDEQMTKWKDDYEKAVAAEKQGVEMMELELKTLGMSNDERQIAIRLRELENKGIRQGSAAYAELAPRIREVVEAQTRARESAAVWDELASRGTSFFMDLVTNGRDAFTNLKDQVKQFAQEMLALFAKRWILNMLGQGSAASQLGSGSLVGSVLNMLTGGSGSGSLGNLAMSAITSLFGGSGAAAYAAAVPGLAATGATSQAAMLASQTGAFGAQGVSMTASAGSAAAGTPWTTTFMSTLAKIPVWGWIGAAIVGGMVASNKLFTRGFTANNAGSGFAQGFNPELAADKFLQRLGVSQRTSAILTGSPIIARLFSAMGIGPENWKAQLGFGSNARAYTNSGGIFGAEGFHNIAGDDKNNVQMQDFMRQTSAAFDTRLAAQLSAAQISSITGNLQNSAQREFAFGARDTTSNDQIGREYLQQKYGAIFDEIDTTFAKFIREYTGKAEDLAKEIDAFTAFIDQVSKSGAKGMNIDALRKMQLEGEELGATMERIGAGMHSLTSMFSDESEQLKMAQDLLLESFGAISVAVPRNVEEWRAAVASIDFSTEAGRNLYNTMTQMAPAFQMVEQAARNTMEGFRSAMAGLYGNSYSRGQIEQQASALIARFQSMTGVTAGTDPLAVFRGIGSVDAATMQQLMSMIGPEAQALLVQILQLYNQYTNLSTATTTVTTGLGGLGTAVTATVDALGIAKTNLREYLTGSLLNQQLSPLNVKDQAAVAMREYERIRDLARTGNIDAMNQLGGSRDQYLTMLRQIEGSNANYNAEWFRTFDEVRGVAGGGPTWQSAMQSALPTSGDRMASSADIQGLRADFRVFMAALVEGNAEVAQVVASAIGSSADKQQTAAQRGGTIGAR